MLTTIVVWEQESVGANSQDLFANGYDGNGNLIPGISQLQISQAPANAGAGDKFRFSPSVAMDSSGNFVVVWHERNSVNRFSIHAATYDAAGAVRSAKFEVNPSANRQTLGRVAMSVDGRFFVVWQEKQGSSEILCKGFDANAGVLFNAFQLTNGSVDNQQQAHIAMNQGNESRQ